MFNNLITSISYDTWGDIVDLALKIGIATLLILLGNLVGKIAGAVISKVLESLRIFELLHKVGFEDLFDEIGFDIELKKSVKKYIRAIVILIFAVAAFDYLGLNVVREFLNAFLMYLPSLFSGLFILVGSFVLAKFIKNGVSKGLQRFSVENTEVFANIAKILVIIFGGLTALEQIGVNISFITQNLTIVISGVVLTLFFAFVYGTRNVFSNIIGGFYVGNNLKRGDSVVFEGKKMTVTRITEVFLVLDHDGKEIFVPNDLVMKRGLY